TVPAAAAAPSKRTVARTDEPLLARLADVNEALPETLRTRTRVLSPATCTFTSAQRSVKLVGPPQMLHVRDSTVAGGVVAVVPELPVGGVVVEPPVLGGLAGLPPSAV